MTRNETFNGLREFAIPGHYFELLSTVNAVDVTIYGKNDIVLSRELAVSQGFVHDRRGLTLSDAGKLIPFAPFSRVEITTGGNEAVKFSISDGLSGDKKAVSDISDKAGRLLGIVYGALGQLAQVLIGTVNALWVADRGYTYGANFASATALTSGTNEQIVAPGSNTAGITIWDCSIGTGQGGTAASTLIGLIAKTSAPASAVDGDVLFLVNSYLTTAASLNSACGKTTRPIFVAAGKGLYFRNSGSAGEAGNYRSISYTIH